ncbi:pyridoxamine 5'-phosphate oxidase family protein [Natronomonas gomsonensis]|uniref:pyridoxamine 5'-phosphate oxidase family protein n=1 Tax=Natronomonas gomsonensis TaxID=1046043 RepID=UPI0015C11565|nr:pyridoxamine 5'-phosphate oxidase family protein [Natronomonas gomsonensis]
MKHVDYVYTVGMTDAELDEFLRLGEHGVLGLADGDDAYAVPLSYHYDGKRLLLRVSGHDDDSEKRRFLETTGTTTFVVFDASTADSWSIQVRGPVSEFESDVDEATLREWFPPFRLFDEAVEAVDFSLFELEMESVVGRRTVE